MWGKVFSVTSHNLKSTAKGLPGQVLPCFLDDSLFLRLADLRSIEHSLLDALQVGNLFRAGRDLSRVGVRPFGRGSLGLVSFKEQLRKVRL